MRVIISIILMVIAALVGFFFGAGMNEAMGGAILHVSYTHLDVYKRQVTTYVETCDRKDIPVMTFFHYNKIYTVRNDFI